MLDWSLRENVGFSRFVSIGSMLDVGWGDLIDYLGDDPHTKSIVIYMESIGDARAFLSAAREVALTKPIIVIKAGRTQAAAKAAALAYRLADRQRRRARRRVPAQRRAARGHHRRAVLHGGSPGETAATRGAAPDDRHQRRRARRPGDRRADRQRRRTRRAARTRRYDALDRLLPPHWSHNNPVDILGDASPERYAQALRSRPPTTTATACSSS